MTGKQKIEAAFSKEGSPEIPAVICYESILIRDHWKELTSCPWWYQFEPDTGRQMKWRREAMDRVGQDWFHLGSCGSREDRQNSFIEARPEGIFMVNKRNGNRQPLYEPEIGGSKHYTEELLEKHSAETPEDIGRLIPAKYDIFDLWGFEEAMIKVAVQPELVEYACKRYLDLNVHYVREAAAMGASGIFIQDCYSDMVNPEAFKRFNVDYTSQLIDEIRSLGMKSIFYFTGNPAGKLGHIMSMGADALSFEESKKNFLIDIEDLVDAVQDRCALLGNLDAIGVLQDGTDEQLRTELARQIRAGRRNGSRFIMSLGSPVTPSTPVDRVRLYCGLVHELGTI